MWSGFSLKWYAALLDDDELLTAAWLSLKIGLLTATASVVIGIVLALPLGMAMGWGLVHLLVELLKNDQFLFPVVISARTYAWAGLCVVAAGLASALVVRRQIEQWQWATSFSSASHS